ncbi:uncharacterized protein LOC108918995 [Scleropages formosus]|uniref:Uncharacterized LOC108918995 n=1 Tax=Scleropages formosus TaxID=113540 RepID=A0A8C9RS91_SCLFO|nr:uncharacterized protein LOC108918995 [Scleropages formosus]
MSNNKRSGHAVEPWIEAMIQNCSKCNRKGTVNAHVTEFGKLSESLKKLAENPVALMFLSDGVVQIPGILTMEAWKKLQEVEEHDTFQSLTNRTVSLRRYSLTFQWDSEQSKSQFVLTLNELATTAATAVKSSVPCCTSLLTVRQQIGETWRSLREQTSFPGVTADSVYPECGQRGLRGELLQDRLNSLLKDLREQLTATPHNSTSQDRPTLSMSSFHQTRWDTDRIRFKREEPFCIPLLQLYIPVQQSRQMQELTGNSPVSVTCNSECEEDDFQLDFDLDENSLMGPGKQEMVPLNPWDIFAPALEITTSSAEGSPRGDKDKELEAAESLDDWMHLSYICAFDPSKEQCSTRSSTSALRPFSLVTTNSTLSLCQGLSGHSGPGDNLLHPLRPCPLRHSFTIWEQETDGKQEKKEDVLKRRARSMKTGWQRTTVNEELGPSEMGAIPRKMPTKLRRPASSEAAGKEARGYDLLDWRTTQDQVPCQNGPKAIRTCPDGTCFSNSYQPRQWQTLGLIRIPDDVVKWAVRYLLHATPSENTRQAIIGDKEGGKFPA